jgi:L-methionine (R)-S-oxide reductase
MESKKKSGCYSRLYQQLEELLMKSTDLNARLATVVAVLYHKMDYFFWTGFYMLNEGELVIRTYQGPVACQVLAENKGVCWAAINGGEAIILDDVHLFPGHITCDSRSQSEIAVPLRNTNGKIMGVLDIDSKEKSSFDTTDAEWLEKIVELIGCGDL